MDCHAGWRRPPGGGRAGVVSSVQPTKTNSGAEKSAVTAGILALQASLKESTTSEQFCKQLAKIFQVQQTEVALMRLESGCLKFLFPAQLKTAGSIPVSSSSSIAAHTATSKKAEFYNNFSRVKHASIFETVKLGSPEENSTFTNPPIQKLISAPVLDKAGNVIGVLQVCRKGYDVRSAGPDFGSEQLEQVEQAARAAAKASFMQLRSAAAPAR
jgi:hypothetical protein